MRKFFLKYIISYFRDVTLKKKLLISYFILIFIPLGLFTFVSYAYISTDYENQIKYSADQSFKQAYTFLSYKINTLIKATDLVYFDIGIQTALSRSKQIYENDIIQQNVDMTKIDAFFDNFRNTEDIYRVTLFVPGWLTYANQDINFSSIDTFRVSTDYKKLVASTDKVLWLPPQKIKNDNTSLEPVAVIPVLRKIRNTNQISEIIGIVKVSILESNIKSIIAKANATKNQVVYLQNSEGNIICCSNEEILNKYNLKEHIGQGPIYKNICWDTVMIDGKSFTVNTRNIENTDWTLIAVIPYSEILSQSNQIRNIMFMSMLIIGVVAYGLAYLISASATKRISMLIGKMEMIQKGDLDACITSQGQDEIGILINSFNYMVKKINVLVDKQFELGKEIKNAELKALQAQINPHFLYNTLDLINWKAIDNDIPEISEISQSLAKFYKLSLNKGKDIVSIEDEIKHVIAYVQIQNLRFDNRINLIIDIDEGIYQYSTLKIILQPLVENSIIHGIFKSRDQRKGVIKLIGRLENNVILLSVQDNGIGMTEEKAKSILMVQQSDNHSYGVWNINNRIKLCYGKQYGLTYHTSLGKGTLVKIKIPALKDQDYHS